MKFINILVMLLAGLLLIAATVLKFHEMIDTCIPSWDVKAASVITTAKEAGEPIPPQWKANSLGFWESYEFFLIQIPLEFALGVWLVCGLFRKAAWIAGTLCYLGFICVTLGKALLGLESCGCFGQIHVNPWITLFAIDVPLFLLLAICRPKGYKLLPPPWPNLFYLLLVFVPTIGLMVLSPAALVTLKPDCITEIEKNPDVTAQLRLQIHKLKKQLSDKQADVNDLNKVIEELRKAPRTTDKKAFIGVLEVIALDKPNMYEVRIGGKQTLLLNSDNLEQIILSITDAEKQEITITETGQVQMKWIEPEPEVVEPPVQTTDTNDQSPTVEQWEWLEYVVEEDVRQQITEGLVVVMMNRYDCPVCEEMAPVYSEYYAQMAENNDVLFKIAFLSIPPYGDVDHVPDDTTCIVGKLTDERKWGLMSPYVIALLDGELVKTWEQGTAPEPENILDEVFGN